MDLPSNINVSFVDIEFVNGFGAGSFLRTSYASIFSMQNVVIRDMVATSSGGAIHGLSSGQATMRNVTFIDCVSSSTDASAINAIDPVDWILEDLTFIDCTASSTTVGRAVVIRSSHNHTKVTFGGDIVFLQTANFQTNLNPAVAFFAQATRNLTIASNPINPSKWKLDLYRGPSVSIDSSAGHTSFETSSFEATDISPDDATPGYPAIRTNSLGSYVSTVFIGGSMHVANLAALDNVSGKTKMSVLQTLNSTGCRATYAISAGTLELSAKDISISDPWKIGIVASSNMQIVADNLQIFRTAYSSTGQNGLFIPDNAQATITVGNTFSVSHLQLSTTVGAAIYCAVGASLTVSAREIIFDRNQAQSNGGALAITGTVSLTASDRIVFSNNKAGQLGGAIWTYDASSSVILNAPEVTFDSNSAGVGGSAIYTQPNKADSYTMANFFNNSAPGDCIFSFDGGSCPAFTPSGSYANNLNTSNSCSTNYYLCGSSYYAPTAPTASPETPTFHAPEAAPCTGSPPAIGSWQCIDGLWHSNGSVIGDTLTVPPNSHLVVNGNLTLSGDLVFTGLDTSIAIQGGCTSIGGELILELSKEELEKIVKEGIGSTRTGLITQNSTCATLTTVSISGQKSSKSCRKIESTTLDDTTEGQKTTLVAAFKVNSSGCNVKWIILGCVLGGILLIALIVILLATFNERVKKAIRPFWARKHRSKQLD
jgi:predicted outer membrane repeat protein